MKNLKISKKLVVGFGLVLVLMAILLGFSLSSLATINAQVEKYSDQTLPATNDVWQMRRDLVSIQRYMLMALAEEDQQKIAQYMDTIGTESARLSTSLQSVLTNPQVDTSKLLGIEESFKTLAPIRQQISEHLKSNTAEDNAIAYQLFDSTYKPGVDKIAEIAEQLGTDQVAQANLQKTAAQNSFRATLITLSVISLLAVVITVFIIIYITSAINRPIQEIVVAMKALSNGQLNQAVVKYESRDELGDLAENIRTTISRLSFIIKDLSRGLSHIAAGDFSAKSDNDSYFIGDFKQLADSTYSIIYRLSDTLSQINQAADQVSAGSDQVSSGAQALSQGATEQASSVQELAATVSEISNQVRENAANSKKASNISAEAATAVEASNIQMQHLMASMEDINSKSKEIGKIIKTIEDIAFQTNILALNAAVEAARAGAAGKGFAVVADEVRSLAGKSADAAQNTTTLIEGSISAIATGVDLAAATATDLSKVVTGVNETTRAINEISNATNEQAQAVSQVTVGLDQISSVVQTNSATSEESAAASEELSSQAQMLKSLISAFKLADISSMDNQASTQAQNSIHTERAKQNFVPLSSNYNSSKY